MTAKTEFYRYAIEQVQRRVCRLVERYRDHRELFEEAHGIESHDDEFIIEDEFGFYFMVTSCTTVVAPDWHFRMKFENFFEPNTPYVWVVSVPCVYYKRLET